MMAAIGTERSTTVERSMSAQIARKLLIAKEKEPERSNARSARPKFLRFKIFNLEKGWGENFFIYMTYIYRSSVERSSVRADRPESPAIRGSRKITNALSARLCRSSAVERSENGYFKGEFS